MTKVRHNLLSVQKGTVVINTFIQCRFLFKISELVITNLHIIHVYIDGRIKYENVFSLTPNLPPPKKKNCPESLIKVLLLFLFSVSLELHLNK